MKFQWIINHVDYIIDFDLIVFPYYPDSPLNLTN